MSIQPSCDFLIHIHCFWPQSFHCHIKRRSPQNLTSPLVLFSFLAFKRTTCTKKHKVILPLFKNQNLGGKGGGRGGEKRAQKGQWANVDMDGGLVCHSQLHIKHYVCNLCHHPLRSCIMIVGIPLHEFPIPNMPCDFHHQVTPSSNHPIIQSHTFPPKLLGICVKRKSPQHLTSPSSD